MQEQILCHVDGCDRKAMYKSDAVCQKHYFRRMRYGHYGLNNDYKAPGERRMPHSNGYIMLRLPGHPLAQKGGGLFEHRKVMYDIHGENLPPCQLCGKESDWHSRATHIDHIDRNRANNNPDNLRVLCNPCNAQRDKRPAAQWSSTMAVQLNGMVLTPTEWARQPGVKVHGATIRHRINKGQPAEQAIYGEKITHNGKKEKIKTPVYPKHARKNAIRVTINDKTMTAAEWSRDPICRITQEGLVNRIKAGWDHYAAVTTPPATGRNKKRQP